nr:MAG TPA: hypothetical protein [Caudoviricetes sp.]
MKQNSFIVINKNNRLMSKERFVLQPSKEMQDGWVATDTENGIVLRFENHRFNDTVRCTPLLADGREPTAIELATAIRELADWLRESHYDKIF